MTVVVIEPPQPFITVEEAKAHLRLDDDEAAASLLGVYVAAACASIDGPNTWLGRALGEQVLELRTDRLCDIDPLPGREVIDIEAVSFLDADGVEQAVDAATYVQTTRGLRLARGRSWPTVGGHAEGVRILYRAGYAAAEGSPAVSGVPAPIKAAVLLMIGDLWEGRSTGEVKMTKAAEDLLSPYRVLS